MPTYFGTALAADNSQAGAAFAAQTALKKLNGNKPQVCIVYNPPTENYAEIAKSIKGIAGDIPIIGCSAYGMFNEEGITLKGLGCALISSDTHSFVKGVVATHIQSDPKASISKAVGTLPTYVKGFPHLSSLFFMDGLTGRGEEVITCAANSFGQCVQFAGGAAGDSLTFNKTSVYLEDKSYADAAVMYSIASKKPIILSVKNGHKPLAPRMTVTKSQGSVIQEINEKPAFNVWKDTLREPAKRIGINVDELTSSQDILNFFLRYEAGIFSNQEFKIRHPLTLNDDDSINFLCSIPKGSRINIMDSTFDDQIGASRQAAEVAAHLAKGAKISGILMFDCVCRSLVMKDKFDQALDQVKKVFPGVPLFGFFSYGEIATNFLPSHSFFNTTTVLMLLPD